MTVNKIVPNSEKIKSVDFNCDTCQVRVLNVSYCCATWKFSKEGGFGSRADCLRTCYTKNQVNVQKIAVLLRRLS